jgi:G:T-mismatch repair DNA endonuclease (very short patch repair protein)
MVIPAACVNVAFCREAHQIMIRVRGHNTHPECMVRCLSSCVNTFRLHGAKLPGKREIVFAARRRVIL